MTKESNADEQWSAVATTLAGHGVEAQVIEAFLVDLNVFLTQRGISERDLAVLTPLSESEKQDIDELMKLTYKLSKKMPDPDSLLGRRLETPDLEAFRSSLEDALYDESPEWTGKNEALKATVLQAMSIAVLRHTSFEISEEPDSVFFNLAQTLLNSKDPASLIKNLKENVFAEVNNHFRE